MAATLSPGWGERLRSAAPWLAASVVAIAVLSTLDVQGLLGEIVRVLLYGWLGYQALIRLFHVDDADR